MFTDSEEVKQSIYTSWEFFSIRKKMEYFEAIKRDFPQIHYRPFLDYKRIYESDEYVVVKDLRSIKEIYQELNTAIVFDDLLSFETIMALVTDEHGMIRKGLSVRSVIQIPVEVNSKKYLEIMLNQWSVSPIVDPLYLRTPNPTLHHSFLLPEIFDYYDRTRQLYHNATTTALYITVKLGMRDLFDVFKQGDYRQLTTLHTLERPYPYMSPFGLAMKLNSPEIFREVYEIYRVSNQDDVDSLSEYFGEMFYTCNIKFMKKYYPRFVSFLEYLPLGKEVRQRTVEKIKEKTIYNIVNPIVGMYQGREFTAHIPKKLLNIHSFFHPQEVKSGLETQRIAAKLREKFDILCIDISSYPGYPVPRCEFADILEDIFELYLKFTK